MNYILDALLIGVTAFGEGRSESSQLLEAQTVFLSKLYHELVSY